MFKSYKFRLYPNKTQARELERTLETHRRLYNDFLDDRIHCWECAGVSLNYAFQCRRFTILKRSNPHYQQVNSGSAQQTIRQLDMTFQAFFNRIIKGEKPGFPRFKGKGQFNSFRFGISGNHPNGFKLLDKKLRLQFIGTIRVKVHREMEGRVKSATIKRENSKWYVVFTCDLGDVHVPESTNPPVGIDLGVRHFLTTSEGEHVENPRPLETNLKELRRRQRSVSRKKKGSNSQKKAKNRVRDLHWHIANQRRDFHHKTAKKLTDSYGFIAAENLNIQGMVKSRRLGHAVTDTGWGQFLTILGHKAESAGARLVLVNPQNTSQQCSNCGKIVQKDLSIRIHRCQCGTVLDRDVNAAKNILARAEPRGANAGVTLHCPGSQLEIF